jgi:hypothetical protein
VRLAVILLLACAWALVTMVRSVPCSSAGSEGSPESFAKLCYSDIRSLYAARGIAAGVGPFSADRLGVTPMEYPPASWYVAAGTGWLTDVLAGQPASSERRDDLGALADQPGVDGETWLYFGINLSLLTMAVALVATLISRLVPGDSRRTFSWFAAPSLLLAGAINWDLLAVAAVVAAIAAWRAERPATAGIAIGVGTALKLFPALLLGALLVLAWRQRSWRPFIYCAAVAATVWALINLPLLLFDPQAWRYFWEFQSHRSADIGSVWQSLRIGGMASSDAVIKGVGYGGFLAGCLVLLVMGVRARVAPQVPDLAFLIVWGFLVTGSVYNPQYALWLLPLALLGSARLRDVAVWQVGELIFFLGIMLHIGGITPPPEGPDKIYVATVGVRLLASAWLAWQVLLRILNAPQPDVDVTRSAPTPEDSTSPKENSRREPTVPIQSVHQSS